MKPKYDINDIKFGTDRRTFERAVGLYENKKITHFKAGNYSSQATVIGTHPYRVSVSHHHFDEGGCDCYLGKEDVLCKHMIAVAIRAVTEGKSLNTNERAYVDAPAASGRIGTLSSQELIATKAAITAALRYIKSYTGPSHTWFAYQDSLSEGTRRLSAVVSDLPANEQTARLLVDLLLRLERKVMNGVDDSDGTVGGFMEETVNVLLEFVRLDPVCAKTFDVLKDLETSFGWEESLAKLAKDS